tara:strand:+ start:52 stop:645 length:594 start_codon:yes stop_codon:yes gene_type:complete
MGKSRNKNITQLKTKLAKNNTVLERLKIKLDKRLAERDNMSKKYMLFIQQAQDKSKRPIDGKAKVDSDYKDLNRIIGRIKAEILSLEGGVITKEVLPHLKRGGFGLTNTYTMGDNGNTYEYQVGDQYFHDKIGRNELAIINKVPNLPVKEQNLGDTAEGGEMSPDYETRALNTNLYQQLQIQQNESILDKTKTNGTF